MPRGRAIVIYSKLRAMQGGQDVGRIAFEDVCLPIGIRLDVNIIQVVFLVTLTAGINVILSAMAALYRAADRALRVYAPLNDCEALIENMT